MSARCTRRRFLVVAGSVAAGTAGVVIAVQHRRPATKPLPPDRSLERVVISTVLRVGIDPSYPPFEASLPDGSIVGFDVDLARALADKLFASLSIVPLGLDGFYDALRARKIDAAISSIVPTWRAGKDVTFSAPYFNAGLVLCVPAKTTARTLQDMAGQHVGVEIGSDADEYLRGLLAGEKNDNRLLVTRFDDIRDALDSLRGGKVAAVLTDAPAAALLKHEITGYAVAATPVTTKSYAVALRAADQALLRAINLHLSELQREGVLRSLAERWL